MDYFSSWGFRRLVALICPCEYQYIHSVTHTTSGWPVLFSTSVRACDMMWFVHLTLPLSLNYGGLNCFLALLPRSFVMVRCLREANVAIFCGRFSCSRQTSLSKGFFYYFLDSITELYFRSATRQCRCYSKTKTTKYCLKHEGKSHPCHPWQN